MRLRRPIVDPGDFVVWVRHDDVRFYQMAKAFACSQQPGADVDACNTQYQQDLNSEVCQLVIYQSLSHQTLRGGDGFYDTDLTADGDQLRINDGHDADGYHNSRTDPSGTEHDPLQSDYGKFPKCAPSVLSTATSEAIIALTNPF